MLLMGGELDPVHGREEGEGGVALPGGRVSCRMEWGPESGPGASGHSLFLGLTNKAGTPVGI